MKDKTTHKTAGGVVEPLKMDGLTTSDPAAQGGAPLEFQHYRSHDGIKKLPPGPGAKALLMGDQIPGLEQTKSENFKTTVGFYDPVRDVQPNTPSGPAALTVAPRDPNKVRNKMDPWQDMGDNGIEIVPLSLEEEDDAEEQQVEKARRIVPELIQEYQMVRSIPPIPPVNINRIGANESEKQEQQPLREPVEIDEHLITSHFIDFNPTLFPIPEVQELHIELHASGEAPDHNPEVLKVAGLEHILGSKEEELNFLPKLGELITFPPEPGEEVNWMFPYSVMERFVESPRTHSKP